DDQPAHLTLVKRVVNDNGGTAAATDFSLSAAGPTPISGPGGADGAVNAGSYVPAETGPGGDARAGGGAGGAAGGSGRESRAGGGGGEARRLPRSPRIIGCPRRFRSHLLHPRPPCRLRRLPPLLPRFSYRHRRLLCSRFRRRSSSHHPSSRSSSR